MTVDGEHEGHKIVRMNGSVGHEDVALAVCMDCMAIVERLFLCEYPTHATGKPCRHAVSAPGGRCETHSEAALAARTARTARPKGAAQEVRLRAIVSPSETRWLKDLIAAHGSIADGVVMLMGIKQGQATLLENRYGGASHGASYNDWQWRCDGPQSARIIAAIQRV